MNTIVQHVPAFVEIGEEPRRAEFSSLSELMAISWVAQWADNADFHRFAQSDGLLIVERAKGRSWWVVGRLVEPVVGLPTWKPIYRLRDDHGDVRDYEGDVVISSCGDDVKLRDGRTMKWLRESS